MKVKVNYCVNCEESVRFKKGKCDNPNCTMNNPILSYHCSDCKPTGGFYLGTTCPTCKTPFRAVNVKPQPKEKVDLPEFLYKNSMGEIAIGYHGDTVVTDEFNKWLNTLQDNELRKAAEKVVEKRKILHEVSDAEPFSHADLKMAAMELDAAYVELEARLK